MKPTFVHRSVVVSATRLRRARRRRLVTLAFVVSIAASFVAGEKVGARTAGPGERARDHLSEGMRPSPVPDDASSGNRESLEAEGASGIGADGNTQLK
jgi:hypothetical protein